MVQTHPDGGRVARISLMRIVVMTIIGLAVAYFAAVFLLQRRLLFPRPPSFGWPARPSDALQVWLPTVAGRVEAWYLPPVPARSGPTPTLVFFHGNGEVIDPLPRDFDEPRSWGVGVLLVEYPGYGRSHGSPSQSSITAAALAAYDWVAANPAVDSSAIIAYGRSLGGAAAIALAQHRPLKALVVESTFTSIKRFARRFGAPEFFVLDPFDSLAVMKTYSGPVLVFHGRRDELVPFEHGQELARAARHAEFHALDCGHNDCVRPWAVVRRFLSASGVLIGDGA